MKKKIAIVDDSTSSGHFLANALRAFEFEVAVFTKPKEALEEIPKNNFDCVLTDYEMPEIKGPELIRKLKEDSRTRHVPVLILSAHDVDDKITEAINAGADDYLSKRINPEVMLAKIRVCLELKVHRNNQLGVERMRTYNAVISSLNHEFNNASTIALGLMDRMKKNADFIQPEMKAEIEKFRSTLERLLKTIKDFTSRESVEFSNYDHENGALILAPHEKK